MARRRSSDRSEINTTLEKLGPSVAKQNQFIRYNRVEDAAMCVF